MLPKLTTQIPGPRSMALSQELKKYECQNTTYTSDQWPVFWKRAEGVNVWDEDGNRFLDLTSAFGVAGLGHGWSAAAMREQSEQLIHGMGDVHPTELKVDVCRKLSEMTFDRWGEGVGKSILSNSGSEAVESALKTAYMATGKKGVISFRNSYHGLGYGALLGSGMEKFRHPFEAQLSPVRHLLDYPTEGVDDLASLVVALNELNPAEMGALIVEPIQGRAGKLVPPDGFLGILRSWCDISNVVLIFDEIYTGFNRTGKLFACEWEAVVPDIICVGKAMSGGYPISACVGRAKVMDGWPLSEGEALHTSTFLGNPVGCAMAVAAMEEHVSAQRRERVLELGDRMQLELKKLDHPVIHEVRGRGLMIGLELRYPDGSPAGDLAGLILEDMLRRGIIMLADGVAGNTLAFTPPFDLGEDELEFIIHQVRNAISSSVHQLAER